MRLASLFCALLVVLPLNAGTVRLAGIKAPVEILRDRWGIPHIYAQNQNDLFFANGWINARDRLFQLDLWRRTGTGKLAEALGPEYADRDRMARLFRFRGDWHAEWRAYSTDTWQIAKAFTSGINAFIGSLAGKRPAEFQMAGFDPGPWTPEDVVARLAGLGMSRNLNNEIARAQDVVRFGLDVILRHRPPQPPVPVTLPTGVNLGVITADLTRELRRALAGPDPGGSNNWVVDGARSATGKPLLASDPHRALKVPSLRRTLHLVAPGWNVIGAGEPGVPGVSLGHNEHIAWGFTIAGADQQDLYVERLNPKDENEYWHAGAWKRMTVEKQSIAVRGAAPRAVELRYTVHGPVIHVDKREARAYALRWVGAEPGGAGYLAALALCRAKNWSAFQEAIARFRIPSENMVYADRAGNIGWVVAGWVPVRKNWTGLLPVPGSGEFEWSGYLPPDQNPREFNPARHFIATANHNILPPGYKHAIAYEWAVPYRYQRLEEMLKQPKKFSIADFERMQYDVLSIPARRFQGVLRRWKPAAGSRAAMLRERLLAWDAHITRESAPALLYSLWFARIPAALFGAELGPRVDIEVVLRKLESLTDLRVLDSTLAPTLAELDKYVGPGIRDWQYGRAARLMFRHPLNRPEFNRGPLPRSGDSWTVNAASGNGMRQGSGASYRQIIDFADFDRSVTTNAPGESGDPASPHYSDLIEDWLAGRYHPMLFSRKAVQAATVERFNLVPAARSPGER